MDKRRLNRLLRECQPQTVLQGERTIYIGFKRSLKKELDKLRLNTSETVILKDVPMMGDIDIMGLNGIKTLIIENIGILDSGAIFGMRDLEKVIIRGTIGYINFLFLSHCDNLKSVTIEANVFKTNDYICLTSCPKLTDVSVKGVFPSRLVHVTDESKTYFDNFKQKGKSKFPIINYRDILNTLSFEEQEGIRAKLHDTSAWVRKFYGRIQEIDDVIGEGSSEMWKFISDAFGSWTHAYKIRKIGWQYNSERKNPTVKTLKRTGPYGKDNKTREDIHFSYITEGLSAYAFNRRKYHLWKIAGKGKDTDKMIRLCRWIHKWIRHYGTAIPNTRYNLSSIFAATTYKGEPGNCWIMAMCLNEALLSIGIKSKYVKGFRKWDNETQYHVFVAAWSRRLKKWIFLDPTYGSYVSDENGQLLSPAEIRYRLINELPMILNEDADYNGDKSYAATYLSQYLAPNMYYLSANTISQHETEGPSSHIQGDWVTLVPTGSNERHFSEPTTTDEELFWQAPD